MKPRRDITLGEMQDECKERRGSCYRDAIWCPYNSVCPAVEKSESDHKPCDWDLTNPPRFNEDQMAFWRGWYAMGADLVTRFDDGHMVFSTVCGDDLGTIERYFDLVDIMEIGVTLDLAEMFGKDGARCENLT